MGVLTGVREGRVVLINDRYYIVDGGSNRSRRFN